MVADSREIKTYLHLLPAGCCSTKFAPAVELTLEENLITGCTPVTWIDYLTDRGAVFLEKNNEVSQQFYLAYQRALCKTGFILGVEVIAQINLPLIAKILRTLFIELLRMVGQFYWLSSAARLLEIETVALAARREAETIHSAANNFFQVDQLSKAVQPGGFYMLFEKRQIIELASRLEELKRGLSYYKNRFFHNYIVGLRAHKKAIISIETALDMGLTGPVLKAAGVDRDLRRGVSGSVYDQVDFRIPVAQRGDALERFNVRFEEIKQSLQIIEQLLEEVPAQSNNSRETAVFNRPPAARFDDFLKGYQRFLKFSSEELEFPGGELYYSLEMGGGEYGWYLLSNPQKSSIDCQYRTPGAANLQSMRYLAPGKRLAEFHLLFASLGVD